MRSRAVALTVPAYIAADLLQQDCAGAADQLRGFDYPPVAAISLAYPMTSIRDDRKDKAGEVPGEGVLCLPLQAKAAAGVHFHMQVLLSVHPKHGRKKSLTLAECCRVRRHPQAAAMPMLYMPYMQKQSRWPSVYILLLANPPPVLPPPTPPRPDWPLALCTRIVLVWASQVLS